MESLDLGHRSRCYPRSQRPCTSCPGCQKSWVAGLADGLLWELGADARSRKLATVVGGYRGCEYGVPTRAGQEALSLMSRRKGILLDPVCTAKAFSTIVAGDSALLVGPSVFWHTGGAPEVFANEQAVAYERNKPASN